ncbi:MAG: type II secretion system protein, partial [Kiritimatiellia bacterium]
LLELLVVITIIAILLGLLYGTIHTVSRYSRETITRGELANIEAAWKQYYSYYHYWPTNDVENASQSTRVLDPSGDIQYEIGPILARMLEGTPTTNAPGFPPLNPDAVSFLELTRFDASAAPISAWGRSRGQRYYVKLDVNGDNTLAVPTDSFDTSSHTTNIFRRVAVWTANPDRTGILIGSWMQ